jgi:hypothetical protein
LLRRPTCLWVGDPTVRDQLNPARLALLDRELERRLGPRAEHVGRFPFWEMNYDWFEGDRDTSVPLAGRTIEPDDPLWKKMTLRRGEPLSGAEPGVAVSQGMLRRLTGGEEVRTLRLRHPTTRKAVAVPVLVVLEDDEIPSGHDFALTREYQRRLVNEEPDVAYRRVYTGPVPESWRAVAGLPEAARESLSKAFLKNSVRWPPDVKEWLDHHSWELRTGSSRPSIPSGSIGSNRSRRS